MSNYIDNIFPINILDTQYLQIVTSIYGDRIHPVHKIKKFHKGIDLGGRNANGQPIYAPYDGKITISTDVGGGNIVTIDHSSNFRTRYMHLQRFSNKTFGNVKQGEIIGFLGTTGKSTGPHLHFEVWANNKHVDPAPYLFGWELAKDNNGNFIKKVQKFSKYGYNVPERDELKKAPFYLNDNQISNHEELIKYCKNNNISRYDTICAVIALYTESSSGINLIGNLPGQVTIKGYFQQTSDWGTDAQRMNLIEGLKLFLNGGSGNGTYGLNHFKNRENNSHGVSVGLVQKAGKDNPRFIKNEGIGIKIVNILWNDYDITGFEDETELDLEDELESINIDDYQASGIWQIVKVIVDPEIKDLQINDTTISMQQGSLYSFFEKICQKPFVEFFGDTYQDQYYFIIRKPPFTRQSFNSLPTYYVSNNEVYNDSLKWNDDQVYSWYQLIPNSNYIGANEKIWQYLKAVFFEEYAEIWGSRPLSITSQYITFQKTKGELVEQQALLDLKFIIDMHSYLPFTRKGTISLKGDRRLKRGMRIYYEPTNEYFYIDSVQQSFTSQGGYLDRTTTLTVSHGMVKENCEIEIDNKFTKSYFNLINFGENLYKNSGEKQETTYENFDKKLPSLVALFNNDKDSFIEEDIDAGINEWYINETTYSLNVTNKEELQITRKIYNQNFSRCYEIADFLNKYRNIKIELLGTTDSHASSNYNNPLGLRRANTIKNIIIEYYREILNNDKEVKQADINKEIEKLKSRITTITGGEDKPKYDNSTNIGRLFNRSVLCKIVEEKKDNKKETEETNIKNPDDGKWHVNREVFTYFLRRQQFY